MRSLLTVSGIILLKMTLIIVVVIVQLSFTVMRLDMFQREEIAQTVSIALALDAVKKTGFIVAMSMNHNVEKW